MAVDKGTELAAVAGITALAGPARATDDPGAASAVDTMANSPAGNAIEAYARPTDGSLTPVGTYPTGGDGRALGSGHSIVVSCDGSLVVSVNAGTNTISAFAATPRGLNLFRAASSGSTDPNSVTIAGDHLVYILDADSNRDMPESSRTRSRARYAASSVITPKRPGRRRRSQCIACIGDDRPYLPSRYGQ